MTIDGLYEQRSDVAVERDDPQRGVRSAGVGAEVPAAASRGTVVRQMSRVVDAVRKNDDEVIERLVLELSRRRRILAPLALVVSAVVMLFEGVKLLVTNWRLTLVQVLPAMWIWVAMFDLKVHLLHGKSFRVIRGPILIPILLAIVAITTASFFLNAVFAFAITRPGRPEVRPAFRDARGHYRVVLAFGAAVGLLLGFSTVVVTRWGLLWFTLSLGIVVGIMMVSYVAIPSRLVGVKSTLSRGEKLKAGAVGGFLGAVVCSPPYLMGRIGILLLGSPTLFFLGVLLLCVGVVLEAGATGAVKAVKMSAKLVAGQPVTVAGPTSSTRP